AACRLIPDHAPYLSTLGAALYRTGNDPAAAAVLERADALHRLDEGGASFPRDLAFLTLVRHRPRQDDAAPPAPPPPRAPPKTPQYATDQEAAALLREAALIEQDAVFPPDPFARGRE